jgi:hypothetical protein
MPIARCDAPMRRASSAFAGGAADASGGLRAGARATAGVTAVSFVIVA